MSAKDSSRPAPPSDAQRHQDMAPEQAVTLYITQMIYLALDRFSGRRPVLTAEPTVATSKAA